MPNDDVSLLADIADIERRLEKAQQDKNYALVEMLIGRLVNRRLQLNELRQRKS